MENTFKTLINEKGEYCGISNNGFGNAPIDGGTSKNRLYRTNVPSLMGMKVTIDSLKKCYSEVDFTNLEVITVEVKPLIKLV